AAALRAENQLLKKQLAEAKTVVPGKAVDQSVQLAQAQAQIAVLRSDKENLLLAKLALENRVKQLTSGGALASTTRPAPKSPAVGRARAGNPPANCRPARRSLWCRRKSIIRITK